MCSFREFLHFLARIALCSAVVAGVVVLVEGMRSQTAAVSDAPYTTYPSIGSNSISEDSAKNRQKTEKPLKPLLLDQNEKNDWGLGKPFRNGLTITGNTPHRLILFTFDDGPDRRTTPLLLDRLDSLGIKAVFFLIANRIAERTPYGRQHAEIAREIVRRGHIIANHTYDHLQLPLLNNEEVLAQIKKTEKVFKRIFGGRPWIIRPPGGAVSNRIDEILRNRGYTTMLWNLGTGDVQVRTAEQVYRTWRRVFERRERENKERGGIIILHDTYSWSVDAFQLIVSDLLDRNCRLLEQGQELYDIVDDPSFFFNPRSQAALGMETPPATPEKAVLESRQLQLKKETAHRCHMSSFK